MILTGNAIKSGVSSEKIIIDPYNENQVGPNSYNLKLHNKLVLYNDFTLDMKKNNLASEVTIDNKGFLLKPGKLYLGRTVERAGSDHFIPMIEGRSSIGRLGMSVHATAGMGQLGFIGYWTLEISVIQPLIIYPFVEVCQISFCEYKGVSRLYGEDGDSKYNDNLGTQTSGLWKEL
jgi:dCTP deaminase